MSPARPVESAALPRADAAERYLVGVLEDAAFREVAVSHAVGPVVNVRYEPDVARQPVPADEGLRLESVVVVVVAHCVPLEALHRAVDRGSDLLLIELYRYDRRAEHQKHVVGYRLARDLPLGARAYA